MPLEYGMSTNNFACFSVRRADSMCGIGAAQSYVKHLVERLGGQGSALMPFHAKRPNERYPDASLALPLCGLRLRDVTEH